MTFAGLTFFHPKPNQLFPQQEILFSQFSGIDFDELVTTHDLSAPLSSLSEQIIQLLRPHLTVSSKLNGVILEDVKWQIPINALREALLNALIHRQYTSSDAIKVALFSDRVEIFSPGNFPGPIDLSQLGNGISYTRNPLIRNLARKSRLVEKRGFGFRLMLSECKKNGNPRPVVVEGPTFVKVTFFRAAKEDVQNTLFPEESKGLLSLLMQNTPFQVREAAILMKVSHGTARTRLERLMNSGWLQREGKGRGTTYSWCRGAE